MNKQKQTILTIATVIGLSASTAALADGVETALDRNSGIKTEQTFNSVSLRHINAPRNIQDHVINFQLDYQQRHIGNDKEVAAMEDPIEKGWRRNLGNPVKI